MTLRIELEAHLAAQLGDPATARTLAAILLEETISWQPPVLAPDHLTTLFAFTFGNRMLPNGNRTPGPVNLALADIVVSLHQWNRAPVFAQWEVAEAIGDRIPAAMVTAINPLRDPRGEPLYLGTTGVIEEVARMVGDPGSLGHVGIVAFADHIYRCVAACHRLGFDAHAPAGVDMPRNYDPESGQAWCRDRMVYLLHDIMIRITERRAAVVGTIWR